MYMGINYHTPHPLFSWIKFVMNLGQIPTATLHSYLHSYLRSCRVITDLSTTIRLSEKSSVLFIRLLNLVASFAGLAFLL